jgi:DNA-binding response OmpR family regulator
MNEPRIRLLASTSETFHFSKVTNSSFANSNVSQPESPNIVSKRSKIVVVDDEKLVADSVAEILKRANYEAFAFYSGENAINFVRGQCPDVVVTDVMMPDLDGVQTAMKIRELCPGTRVLLFSGHSGTAELLNRARNQGHEFEVLPKPLHPDELLRRLA